MGTSLPTPSAAGGRRWYRSLYGRIATAFVFTVAVVIAVQGLAVVWLLGRAGPAPGPPPPGFARLVAQDIGRALEASPSLDLDRFLRDEYERRLFPFVVVMADGRVLGREDANPTPEVLQLARAALARARQEPRFPGRGGPPDAAGDGLPRRGLGRGAGRGFGDTRPGVIMVGNQVVGVVVPVPQTIAGRLGPTLMLMGGVSLALAAAAMTVLVFGPVRRRLAELERAALDIGQGRLDSRATEEGGDEVASLAHSFNKMAQALATQAHEAREADRMKRLLLADVSHELRTPLTSMRGYLETLAMPAVSSDEATRSRYLRIVSDETRRLEDIVGDLLDLSRLDAGGTPLDMQDAAVESIFGSALARHGLQAADGGVELVSTIGEGAEIVRGDARRLEQAVQNLVANALRHTPKGGTVSLSCQLEGDVTVIAVRDTGRGISPAHLPHIFDRFYKADASRSDGGTGSGLGLSIVKAVVDRHGGTVTASSGPTGTTFEIRLPTTAPPAAGGMGQTSR